jgi:hypothetical protein
MHIEMRLGPRVFSLITQNLRNLLVEGVLCNFSSTYRLFYNYLSFFGHSTYCAKL